MVASTKLFKIITELKLPPGNLPLCPIGIKLTKAVYIALPDDIRGWFLKEALGDSPYSKNQFGAIARWIYSDIQTAKIDQVKVARIREARLEQILDIIRDSLPGQSLMTYLTSDVITEQYGKLAFRDWVLPSVGKSLKSDVDRVNVAVHLAHNSGYLKDDDLLWLSKITRPIPVVQQLVLIPDEDEFTGWMESSSEQEASL